MKKRIVVAVVAILMAASAYAQKADLFAVVNAGTPQKVQSAIDGGADVNAWQGGMTPLMEAVQDNKRLEVITILLKAGADVNAQSTSYPAAPALVFAAYSNPNPEVITALLKAGADIEARDMNCGRTSLLWAALGNPNPEVITRLLKSGSNAKVKADNGETALDLAKYNPALEGTDALRQLEEASK